MLNSSIKKGGLKNYLSCGLSISNDGTGSRFEENSKVPILKGLGHPELNISVKIVSGVKQSGIPDTIKMSEAAGQ
jgi:hypothetical protein